MRRIFVGLSLILTSLALLLLIGEFIGSFARAATLQLSWVDNSTDEDGFNIERSLGSGGPYAVVATVGPNVTTYSDANLLNGTNYCYRVNAFNSAGASPYTPETCGMTAAASATFNLTVSSTGTGSGTVTSSPAGINCGSTCSSNFNSGTIVTLTATPASGSTFAGWSGSGCTSGSVTMNGDTSCTATFNLQPPQTQVFALSVAKAGTGSGTVTSSPAGISCGSICSSNFNSGTVVTLTATPASGSTFAGWSGDSDCSDGSVTMNASKSCTATFTANSTTYTLTVAAIGNITATGTGKGKVVSTPTGIDCGAKCTAIFQSGTAVTLQAISASGSVFTGWSGDPDCSNGTVTMNAAKTCTATFQSVGHSLAVSHGGTGTGKVTSNVSGIDCGTKCFAQFPKRKTVKLKATPASDSIFAGWSGDADCLSGSVTVNGNKACTATFIKRQPSSIGLFRPSTGAWYLINNDTGTWQGCGVDLCLGTLGQNGDQAIAGDWNGSGKTKIGVYDLAQNSFELDDGNGAWGGCGPDTCLSFTVPDTSGAEQTAVVGSWNGSGRAFVGIYQVVPNQESQRGHQTTAPHGAGYWYLDRNGNGQWDGCRRDKCFGPFGGPGEIPVVGDWTGNGIDKIGTFDPATGEWHLDLKGNGKWNGCKRDRCLGPFGTTGDIPVVGDWDGSGTSKIGVFRPSTGEWFLDLNGNGQWDGANVDKYIPGFGQAGDLPVVGKW